MWPWEHLSLGYLIYSGIVRARARHPPGDREALVLVFGTQFPDLIDKTLGWVLGILPGGLTLAHSLLFAVPLFGIVVFLTRGTGAAASGFAFTVGYLSHLLGDVIYPWLVEGAPNFSFLLWPITGGSPMSSPGVIEVVRALFLEFTTYLTSSGGRLYLLGELCLLTLAVVIWLKDDMPGWPGL